MHGFGKYKWIDGREYEVNKNWFDLFDLLFFIKFKYWILIIYKTKIKGEWKDSKLNGYGTNTWPNGNIYKGHYANDKKNGYGIFTWEKGKFYDGFYYSFLLFGQIITFFI